MKRKQKLFCLYLILPAFLILFFLPQCKENIKAGFPGESYLSEVSENINKSETGNLGLTVEEELDIVEFLKTFSDGYILTDK
jgi:hypothetical protein